MLKWYQSEKKVEYGAELMTRVIVSEDCGNSPKNIRLEQLTIAFAKVDSKFILDKVTDNVCWNIIGGRTIQGKDDFAKALEHRKDASAVELTVLHIATHGKAGAVNGTTKLKNGKTYGFCDMYEFGDAKGSSVKEITSYLIEIK
jgi:hypothetical protein